MRRNIGSKGLKKAVCLALGVAFGLPLGGGFCPALAEGLLRFEETVFDFGEVWRFDKVNHEFVFRNVGDETVKVLQVRESCGCTATMISQEDLELEPGEKGILSVTFDSTWKYGEQDRTVKVYTDNPTQKDLVVHMKGVVKDRIVSSVRMVDFGKVPKGILPERQTVTLESGDGVPFEVTQVTSRKGLLDCSFEQGEKGQATLLLGFKEPPAPDAPELLGEDMVLVHTTHPELPEYKLRTRWFVTKEIVCPERRVVMVTEQGRAVRGTFHVVRLTEGSFQITGIEPLEEFVSQEIERLGQDALRRFGGSDGYKVTLSVSPSAPVGNHMRDLFVKTDDPVNTDVEVIFALRVHPSKRRK